MRRITQTDMLRANPEQIRPRVLNACDWQGSFESAEAESNHGSEIASFTNLRAGTGKPAVDREIRRQATNVGIGRLLPQGQYHVWMEVGPIAFSRHKYPDRKTCVQSLR